VSSRSNYKHNCSVCGSLSVNLGARILSGGRKGVSFKCKSCGNHDNITLEEYREKKESTCPKCNGHMRSIGVRKHGEVTKVVKECDDCHYMMQIETTDDVSSSKKSYKRSSYDDRTAHKRTDIEIDKLVSGKKFVITSAVSGWESDQNFVKTLLNYCRLNSAELIIIPIRYMINETSQIIGYDSDITPFLVYNNFDIRNKVRVLGTFHMNAALENPLSGLDAISRGKHLIVGHPQVALKTLPVNSFSGEYPPILSTTGTISIPRYSDTKQGYKADFNHSFSTTLVEFDTEDNPHIRQLHFDGEYIYDLDSRYDTISRDKISVEAVVTGDEHIAFIDPDVVDATYGRGGMIEVLNPTYIIRHDVLDCYSISHHHKNNVFTQFAKHSEGTNSIEYELEETIGFINNTTPLGSINVIISSNHNDHLYRWLNECDPKKEPWNALVYHKLMYLMLENTKMSSSGTSNPDPLELYSRDKFKVPVMFLGRSDSFRIGEVELNSHGDIGSNGSRGSRKQYAYMPEKYVIGHSHSPGIDKGCYQVGTSSRLKLEYNKGPSSWHHCHCIVHKNGTRQLIFIQNGRWKV